MLLANAGAAGSGNGGNFLIPNGTFVVELVIFLVVLGVIAKWILPPLQEVSETRQSRIDTAVGESRRRPHRERAPACRARQGTDRGTCPGSGHRRPCQSGGGPGGPTWSPAGPGGIRPFGESLPRRDSGGGSPSP